MTGQRSNPNAHGSEQQALAGVLRRNIRSIIAQKEAAQQGRSFGDEIADTVTRFTGSLRFVWIHAILFGGWILYNSGLFAVPRFDPFPFVMLAMIASVEAIFLSTFVLISQNRMAALAEKRADLELQINLLAEHETTRLIVLVDALAQRFGVNPPEEDKAQLEELKHDVPPELVLDEIARAEQETKT